MRNQTDKPEEEEVNTSEGLACSRNSSGYGSIATSNSMDQMENNVEKIETESSESENGGGETEEEEEEEFIEGGWGWIVVLASFLCNMTLDGIGYAFGVLLEPMRKDFNSDSGSISLVGSILTGVLMLAGPLSAALVNRVGAQNTCLLGSMMASGAILGSSFTTSVPWLIVSYGIFGGLGLGLIYVPSVVTVGQYFKKRLNFATGICVCGSGAGTFVFAPVTGALVDAYGWRITNRVMSVLCLLCSIFGLAYKKRKQGVQQPTVTNNQVEKKSFDLKVLANKKFLLIMLANMPTVMAVYAVYSYIPPMAQSTGISVAHSSTIISAIGVTNTIGRILCGWMSDLPCMSPLVVTIIASLLGGVFPVILPYLSGYYVILALCGFFGFVISALPTVTTALVVDVVGRESLNSAFGALTFVRGTAALVGPPVSGLLYDLTGSYVTTFAFSSGMLFISAIIHSIAYIIQIRERRNSGYVPI